MNSKTTRRKESAHDNLKKPLTKDEKVLEGARQVFMEYGFSAATTDMIQRAAGVSKSTVYAYYPNKEKLFTAVVESQSAAVSRSVVEIPNEGDDLYSVLTHFGRSYLRLAASPQVVSLYRTVIAEVPRFPHLGRFFYETGPKRAIDLMTAQIEKYGQSSLSLPDGITIRDVVILFMEMLRGDAQMRILTGISNEISSEELTVIVERAVTTIFRAYAKDQNFLASPAKKAKKAVQTR